MAELVNDSVERVEQFQAHSKLELPTLTPPPALLLTQVPINDDSANIDIALEAIDLRQKGVTGNSFDRSTIQGLSKEEYKQLISFTDKLEVREREALQRAEREILEGNISLESVRWVRRILEETPAETLPGYDQSTWFASAEELAGFPDVLQSPDIEHHHFLEELGKIEDSLLNWRTPINFDCFSKDTHRTLDALPKDRYQGLTSVEAYERLIDTAVHLSKDPQNLHLAVALMMKDVSENPHIFKYEVSHPSEVIPTIIEAKDLRNDAKLGELVTKIVDGFREFRNGIEVGPTIVSKDRGQLVRNLSPDIPKERMLLSMMFQGALEEFIHGWQGVHYEESRQKDRNNKTNTGIELPDGSVEYTLSPLAHQFFSEHPQLINYRDSGEAYQVIAEVDVLAKMIELYQKMELPISMLKPELCAFHSEWRYLFTTWLVETSIIPSSEIPDRFFSEDFKREALKHQIDISSPSNRDLLPPF